MALEINSLLVLAFLALVTLAAITDVQGLRIPNWISAALVLLFAVYLLAGRNTLPALQHLAIAVSVLALGFAAFTAGYMGAGDVKLMSAVALWAGPTKIFSYLFLMALSGAALALLILVGTFYLHWDGSGIAPNRISCLFPRWVRQGLTPYGVAIWASALLSVPPVVL